MSIYIQKSALRSILHVDLSCTTFETCAYHFNLTFIKHNTYACTSIRLYLYRCSTQQSIQRTALKLSFGWQSYHVELKLFVR